MGEKLCEIGVDRWMNSSSVHHPTEYGGEDICVESLIEEGFKARLNTVHDDKIAKVAKKTGLTPEKVKDVLEYFDVVMKPEGK